MTHAKTLLMPGVYTLLFLCFFCLSNQLNAQQCGTPDRTDAELKAFYESLDRGIAARNRNMEYHIPVKLIIYNDDNGNPPVNDPYIVEKIAQSLEAANVAFDNGMTFFLCEVEEVDDSDYYQPIDADTMKDNAFPVYNSPYALNVHLINQLVGDAGYAYSVSSLGDYTDVGFIIDVLHSKTIVHEIGHVFGLDHTFRASSGLFILPDDTFNEHLDPDFTFCFCCGCTEFNGLYDVPVSCVAPSCGQECICTCDSFGDFICETPVDPGDVNCTATSLNATCTLTYISEIDGTTKQETYSPDWRNYMSYYGSSRNRFLGEQLDVMLSALLTHGTYMISDGTQNCQNLNLPDWVSEYGEVKYFSTETEGQVLKPLNDFAMFHQEVSNPQTYDAETTSINGEFPLRNNVIFAENKNVAVGQRISTNEQLFSTKDGLTVADIVLIQNHINTTVPFQNPYQQIAADVTNDGQITVLDMIKIRSIILEIDTEFEFVPTYRMFPKYALNEQWGFSSYFQNNPFTAVWTGPNNESRPYLATGFNKSYLDDLTINLLNPDAQELDTWTFYAIKSGDVNFDYNQESELMGEEEAFTLLNTQHAFINTGQLFTVEVELKAGEDIRAYQMGLQFDQKALELVGLGQADEGLSQLPDFSEKGIKRGAINTVWIDESTDKRSIRKGSASLFKLYFKAKQSIRNIAKVLTSQKSSFDTYFYNADAEKLTATNAQIGLHIVFEGEESKINRIFPNPTTNEITIEFELSKAGSVVVNLLDQFGNAQKYVDRYDKGKNTLSIKDLSRLHKGIIHYSIQLENDIYAGSFIKL
ncbi:MAG: cohesin domain-containing protein [Chitinophagales bacterium]|nr:cohesin domain-containing protein [Chitinophagales bacterium]